MIPPKSSLNPKSAITICCVALSMVFRAGAQSPNLVQNGSFEVITVVPGVETRAQPWFGSLSYNENWDNAPDGVNYADIDFVYQDVSVVPGHSYSLTFWAAADLYVSESATILVKWGNSNVGSFVTEPHPYNPMINRDEQIVWQQFTLPALTAETSVERLWVQADNGGNVFLDEVSLYSVPEPSSIALIGAGSVLVLRRKGVSQ